jgi:hypothetical protein
MSDVKDFKKLKDFVETHREKYTYVLLQMIGNEKTILSAYVYLDDHNRLCGEINDVDKSDMRTSMNIGEHLTQISFTPEDYGHKNFEVLNRIRSDLIRAKVPHHQIVELAVFNIDGKPTSFYKQLRAKGL